MSDGRETPDADTRGDSDPHARSVVDAAHSMLAADAAAMSLGITIDEVSVGHAVLTMTVTAGMVNGLEVCHGGVIFTLADTAMAVASNACGRRTLASSAAIEFLAPARVGDVLTATCDERIKPGRSALNDTTVVNHEGVTIAEFRGRTVTVGDR
ncbi:MAG: hotdog fold thioesterase [Acidimicrobiales bacterium]